ncbi:Uncharacterised protein [Streptococcus pneumoniae]|nr:Uncharacterised protein [Streptococcus pneumoniae]VKF20064.1 Uncharacterised protein [Streptococcus pneumoniae]
MIWGKVNQQGIIGNQLPQTHLAIHDQNSPHPENADIKQEMGNLFQSLLLTLCSTIGKGFLQIIHKFLVNFLVTLTFTGQGLDSLNTVDVLNDRRRQNRIGFHGIPIHLFKRLHKGKDNHCVDRKRQ